MNDTRDIRLSNITSMFRIIMNETQITRKDLAKRTGLSLMTVTILVNQLLEMGLVVTLETKNENKNGRKANLLAPNINNKWILILNLNDYYFSYEGFDLALNSLGKSWQYSYDSQMDYEANLTECLCQIKKRLLEDGSYSSLLGVGVIVPGPFLPETGSVTNKRISELCFINVKKVLQNHFPDLLLYIEEDVKFATYSLLESFVKLKSELISYIYIEEGVGGGMIYNQQIMLGKNSVVGDVGQMMANESQNYEELLSVKYLYRAVVGEEAKGNYDYMMERILETQKKNPELVEKCLQTILKNLASLLYNIVWVINPHIAVIECDYLLKLYPDCSSKTTEYLQSRLNGNAGYMPDIIFWESSRNSIYRGGVLNVIELYIKNFVCKGLEEEVTT